MTEQKPAKLISELVADPGFPQSAVGETVDIRGYTGVIIDVVNNSIKVRSAEGNTTSYNYNALRRLYGPRVEMEPATVAASAGMSTEFDESEKSEPKRDIIAEPDFKLALEPIESLVHRSDFPQCAFGHHVDFHGYTGVVVELLGRSLKVRASEGATRSYNADGLRKIYANQIEAEHNTERLAGGA